MPRGFSRSLTNGLCSFFSPYFPGVMNPHAQVVQQWNKFYLTCCLFAVFLDPLFYFVLFVHQDNKCIVLNWSMTRTMIVLRSMSDFIYLLHMILQFRLAYVAHESSVVGTGELVADPKKIAKNYFFGFFFIDFLAALPIPQIIILLILPWSMKTRGSTYKENLLLAAILGFVPRLFRFLYLVAGRSAADFTSKSSCGNIVINLLTYALVSHVIGSYWYLFGLQRVNQCLQNACRASNMKQCLDFIDCGHGIDYQPFTNDSTWESWKNNENAAACFRDSIFYFGIYKYAVNLTTHRNLTTRYIYSLFWGLQQIGSLAANQIPTYFVLEILFTMVGLILFGLLIGSLQNFIQNPQDRWIEMSVRCYEIELWMSHRRFPKELRRQVQDALRLNWAARRGVHEGMLMKNLPEDLQREIWRYLFTFVKKVRIFQLLDEPIIDAICERLITKTYIRGGKILSHGTLVDKMVFIIQGKMESIGEDHTIVPLLKGDVCGEELLTWCLEHSSVNEDDKTVWTPKHGLLSNRLVRCLTNVEAFILRAADLEEVIQLFASFFRSPHIQGAVRYESAHWRGLATRRIQAAWRYRMKLIGNNDPQALRMTTFKS